MTSSGFPWPRPSLVAAAILCTIGVFVLSYPALLGWTLRAPLDGLIHEEGHCWSARLPDGVTGPRKRIYLPPDKAQVLEDGVALARPVSTKRLIAYGGWGRFRVDRDKVLISSSDDAGPLGRSYKLQVGTFSVPEDGLLVLWAAVAALWVWILRSGWRPAFVFPPIYLVGGLSLLYVVGLVAQPVYWADQFFETLWLPVLWSGGLAFWSRRSIFFLLPFSLLPAAASYLHYAVGGASHDSFVVAGAIPWSDAWGHFEQAAQIGNFGVTNNCFNGRYLYPLVLSTAMWITGWNVQMALAVLLGMCLAATAMVCRVLRPISGWAGTSLLALGCLLYLRENVAGICMTEALGFFAGALGTAGIVVAAARHSVRWFFAGLLLLGLGMAARPGALFALPALAICAALFFGRHRPLRSFALFALAVAASSAPFVMNAGLGRLFTTGSTVPFNNAAFSLHGMLLGKNWKASTEETGYNAAAAMRRSKQLLAEKPWLLVAGYARSLDHLAGKKFLFRFGQESRLAATMTVLAGLGLIGVWLMPGWRSQAPWLTFAAGGLLLSLPFAPPWDAGERPYAVTVPMLGIMAAAGVALFSNCLGRFGRVPGSSAAAETDTEARTWIGILGSICALAVLIPIARSWSLSGKITATQIWPPHLRSGSMTRVDDVATYLEKLSTLLAMQGDSPGAYLQVGQGAILGIDWNSLAVVAVADPIPAEQPRMVALGPLNIDPKVQSASPLKPSSRIR